MEKILNDGFAALGIAPDTEAVGRLQTYYEYLEERNKVMNLTAINGLEDVARLHFSRLCGAADGVRFCG